MPLTDANQPTLAHLNFVPYINDAGQLPMQFSGKVGIYAIFDGQQTLQFVGYSRNVMLSLKQHLIRCPSQCYWVKVTTIDRPSRSVLEDIQQAWVAENGTMPAGNGEMKEVWTQPIDAKVQMTPEEQESLDNAAGDLERTKRLKSIARRVEADINAQLASRGLVDSIRFDPKMKEQGLLNVKP